MHLELANPQALWALCPIALLGLIIYYRGRRSALSWRHLLFTTTAFALCIFGLARPQFGQREIQTNALGSNIVLAIDISKSMLADDITPSRLLFSTTAAKQLVDRLEGARFALYPFAADGYLQLPLTSDAQLVSQMISMLSPTLTTSQGTDLTTSLETLLAALQKMEQLNQDKNGQPLPTQVVLFSDGETHAPLDKKILRQFKAQGIPIFTIGTGTLSGSKIIDRGRPLRNRTGKIVYSKLDPEPLKQIANQTGATYYPSTLEAVADLSTRLNRSQEVLATTTQLKVTGELYPWLFAIALALFLIEFSFGRWEYAIRGIALFAFLFPALSQANLSEEGLLKKLNTAEETPLQAIYAYNLATLYRDQNAFKKAAEFYQESIFLTEEVKLKKKALFNLGNSLIRLGEFPEALKYYQEAYDTKVDDNYFNGETNKKISENMVLAKKILSQMKMQGKSQKQGEGGDQQQAKDPRGPKKKYKAQRFSEARKRRIFDLLASKEQETLQRLQQKQNKGEPTPTQGKQW